MAKMVMSLIRPRFNYDSLLLKKSHPPNTKAPKSKRKQERAWEFCSKPLRVQKPSHPHTHSAKKERKTTPPPLCFLSAAQ